MSSYTSYGSALKTPLVGSTPVWCVCGARGVANKKLLKRGQTRITACVHCRGSHTPPPAEPKPEPEYRPATAACQTPLTRGPNQGQPATGTTTGYQRHYRHGEPPCTACRQAQTEYDTQRNKP